MVWSVSEDAHRAAALLVLRVWHHESRNDPSLDVEDADRLVSVGVKLNVGDTLQGELQRVPG